MPSITLRGTTPPEPTTRFNTDEAAEPCTKRVISLTPMEKLCHWMMAFALLVIVSALPELEKVALPETTLPPVGLARVSGAESAKHAATETAMSFGLSPAPCIPPGCVMRGF
jgi:hypothetical protein